MEKDFHIELIKAISEPDQAKWDYLDNLRKQTNLSKGGFIAKLKDANNNIFQAWKSLEMDQNLKLPGVENWSFPFNSFLYYPHLKDFSTQFQGHINEQHLKNLENFIKLYELRILQKEYLKKAKKAKSSKEKEESENNEEEIKNTFYSMPFDQIKDHFKPLIEKKNPKGIIWMTNEAFDVFLKRSFEEKINLSKPKINIGFGGKYAIVKLFYQFYNHCQNESLTENRSKNPFIELLKNAFDTKDFDDLTNENFKGDKSDFDWN